MQLCDFLAQMEAIAPQALAMDLTTRDCSSARKSRRSARYW